MDIETQQELVNIEIAKRIRELNVLLKLSQLITQPQDLKEIQREAIRELVKITGADRACILTVSQDESLSIQCSYKFSRNGVDGYSSGRGFEMGEDLVRRVINERMVYAAEDLPEESSLQRSGSMISLPLISRKQNSPPLGVVNLYFDEPRGFPEKERAFLYAAVTLIAAAMEMAELLRALEDKIENITLINEMAKTFNSSLDLDKTLHIIASQMKKLVSFDRISIALLDETGENLRVYSIPTEPGKRRKRKSSVPVEGSKLGFVIKDRRPLVISDLELERLFPEDKSSYRRGMRSSAVVPLVFEGKAIGTINLEDRRRGAFGPREVGILTQVADYMAIAVKNAQLHSETQSQKEELEAVNDILRNALSQLERVNRRIMEMKEEAERKNEELLIMSQKLDEQNAQLQRQQDLLREANESLAKASITDGLTGLYNHKYFKDRFEIEFKRAQRYDHTLACMMIDIDHFKVVNDTYGHQAGDEVLREIARIITNTKRATDIIARYGGEEMAVVLPKANFAEAKVLAERIRQRIAENVFLRDTSKIRITVSIGISSFAENRARSADELLMYADRALYKAKALGRNRTVCYLENGDAGESSEPKAEEISKNDIEREGEG
ncbi:MAG: diguanylate cyclase [bacterium]